VSATTVVPLHPYAPLLLREWLTDEPDSLWRCFDGTLVFVDISGFTKLSERLARAGNIGAEELTDTIGSCFAGLLGIAYAAGGSLLKFGGDALLLLFRGDDHAQRGCRAAVGMRAALRDLGRIETSAGRVILRMSIGAHSGPLHFFLVGGSHREFMISGPGATQTVTMEAAANAGQIIVSAETAAQLPPSAVGAATGPGYLLRSAPKGEDLDPIAVTGVDDGALRQAIPLALRTHLESELRDAEHRRVTVAFLKFKGIDDRIARDGPAATAEALDTMIRTAQDGADRNGVTFLGTDVDAGGGKVLLAAGAPTSGGNDEERMLLALRDIIEQPCPIPYQIGVHAGHVFAGDIGPPYRRAYTVMGDAVNLAARVMSRSSAGEILATNDVLDHSRTMFEVAQLEPFMVKGKSQPVIASTVGSVIGSRDGSDKLELPLTGRDAELAAFDGVLEQMQGGTGRLVRIIGDIGMGKSRLLEAFRERAGDDVRVPELTCELHRASTPYGAARKLFRGLADIPSDVGSEEGGRQLLALLEAELPDLVEWAPLLAIAFGAELPATQTTANLDEQYVRPRLHDAALRFLARRWPGPTLVTIEDVQWMDDASTDLFRAVVARIERYPWVMCTTRREHDADDDPDHALTLVLGPLDEAATLQLANAATAHSPLPAHEMAVLVERSAGNPLFLEELIATTLEVGGVEQLPDSIEALTTARIDRLPHRERTVLSHVSVLGQRFPLDLATAVLPDEVDDDVWTRLGDFLERDGDTVRFRHALTRDVAYGGLRYRRRRELHARVGDEIARTAGREQTKQAALLSFHFFHAQRYDEAWRYSLVAAEQARAVYANAEATIFLQRAIDASRGVDGLGPLELSRIHEQLGDVRDLMGGYRDAVTAYRTARRLLPPDPVDEARLILKEAREHGWLSKYSQALRWIRRGLRSIKDVEGEDAARQRAQLSAWYARFCEEEGRHRLALRWCDRAIAAAELAGDTESLAHAHRILGRANDSVGELAAAAAQWERALSLYEDLGDLNGQGAITNNLAALAYYEGNWNQMREYLERSLSIYERVGDQDGIATAKKNLGQLLCEQGLLTEAAEMIGDALRIFQAAGHRASLARAQRELAWVSARAGRHAEAIELLAAAHAAFRDVGAGVDDIDTMAVGAECELLQGKPAEALTILDEAIALDGAMGGTSAQSPLLHRLSGYALMRTGRPEEARTAFQESLEAGQAREMDYEVALTLRALAELVGSVPDMADGLTAADLGSESQAILDRLGVVWVPVIPLGTTH
jgi:class 3 adenylate cyclase/tetratricopeptide (TPR) repeat protein